MFSSESGSLQLWFKSRYVFLSSLELSRFQLVFQSDPDPIKPVSEAGFSVHIPWNSFDSNVFFLYLRLNLRPDWLSISEPDPDPYKKELPFNLMIMIT